jgi:SLT domain-containing protein
MAVNRTDSNAARGTPSKGLMQTIGPTFASYALRGYDRDIFDPLSNILAGLRYIKARYKSIFNVQQAVGATPHGYDNGGWASPGWNFNGTSKPEMMLNNAQGAALEQNIRGIGGGHHTTVYIDGVAVAHKAVVEKNNGDIIRSLRAGQK